MFKADVENHTSQENHPDKRTKVRRVVVDALSKKALAELFFGSAKAFCDAWVYRQTSHRDISRRLIFIILPLPFQSHRSPYPVTVRPHKRL